MTITPEKMMAALKRSRELWQQNCGIQIDPRWDMDHPDLNDHPVLRRILNRALYTEQEELSILVTAIQYLDFAEAADPADAVKLRETGLEFLQQLNLDADGVRVFSKLFPGGTSGY